MLNPTLVVIVTSFGQAAVAILLATLLLGFYRHYRRSYLLQWSWSWWALCVYMLGASLAVYLAPRFHQWHPYRLTAGCVMMVAGYLQVGWLLFGTYELTHGRPVSRRVVRVALLALGLVGLVSVFASRLGPVGNLALLRLGVRSLVIGLAFGATGYLVYRSSLGRAGFGRRLVSGAFLLYGAEQTTAFVLILLQPTGSVNYLLYHVFSGLLLNLAMGLGMVVWLLEEERERVVVASQQIEHLAYHDPMTGLPNRQLFLDRLQVAISQANRSGFKVAVLFLDLDRFKVINDSLGHSFGDKILCGAAERLRGSVREVDTVARLGGDEFTILLTAIDREDDVRKVAQKLLETLRFPFTVHDHEFYVTTSIGISLYPDDGLDAETLLKNSDAAMYRAKDHGRDNCQFYAPIMNARALERLALENSLRKGLANNEFVLFYQPIINLTTGQIEGVEALIRWQHPEFGIVAPSEFLVLAETLGLMDPLSDWVMREACAQVRVWQQLGFPDLRIAVNLSARPFQNPELVRRMERVLEETGLRPECLELEITEDIAMQDADASLSVLNDLKKLGVRISIDDFGTGYSSLSYLRNFPIDTLKIDRSFVRDLTADTDAAAIASAVIALAHSLRIAVVAEGVETEEQRYLLKRQRCDRMQGYLFSRAVPAEDFEALLFDERNTSRARSSAILRSWEQPLWETTAVSSD
jgi:diguanylate cyclase (GGDEF)-like protein